MSAPPRDPPMDVKIEKMVYGGDGLAHDGAATVFVPYVLPGEDIRVAQATRKKKFVRGQIEGILQRSPERIAPRCRHFTRCGGCHYQHAPHDLQLRWKTEILRETLRRLGRIEWSGEIAAHSASPWEYRNRAQWKLQLLHGNDPAHLGVGYFQASSETLCPIEECPILSPLLQRTLDCLREAALQNELPEGVREVEAFADSADEATLITAACAQLPPNGQDTAQALQSILPGKASVRLQAMTSGRGIVSGPGFLSCRAAGHDYHVSFDSFFQVNRFLLDDLLATVTDIAGEGSSLFDLYAGVGFFSASLASRFKRVMAVESNPAASSDLAVNLAAAGGGASCTAALVEEFLRRAREHPDVILLDPPRAGLAPAALEPLAGLRAPRILYLSCEPSTLARDLAALVATGYLVRRIELFDMFPQTYHIESLVVLERST
jgi:23S rRNA (uracil1939-C5)-methyltransferase